jgi:hypothetical protein
LNSEAVASGKPATIQHAFSDAASRSTMADRCNGLLALQFVDFMITTG